MKARFKDLFAACLIIVVGVVVPLVTLLVLPKLSRRDDSEMRGLTGWNPVVLWRKLFPPKLLIPSKFEHYAGIVEFPIGRKLRPSRYSLLTFELLKVDTNAQKCEFNIVFDRDSTECRGEVGVSNTFQFCPRLDRIGVYLQEVRPTSAVVVIPGLVRPELVQP